MPLWSAKPAEGAVAAPAQGSSSQDTSQAASANQAAAVTSDPGQLRQEAENSINTYLITTANDDDAVLPRDELPEALARAIEAHVITLLELIKILRESLTNEEAEVRSLAVQLLSLVVTKFAPVKDLAPGTFKSDEASKAETTGQEIGQAAGDSTQSFQATSKTSTKNLFDKQAVLTLSTFFSSKLEDGELVAAELARRYNSSIAPVQATASWKAQAQEGGARLGDKRWLGGTVPKGSEMLAASVVALQELASLDTCGVEAAKTITSTLIEHVQPTNHTQGLRFLIFKLMDILIARYRHTALKSMGVDFLRGYVKLAKGEKDPRNLMILFATDRVLLIDFAEILAQDSNHDLIEAFFDITFCYFPITFRPPPDDPYKISSQDLKAALRGCLTANPLLAPHAMPLLLEKLSATGGASKRDTLETLREAFPVYGRAATKAHQDALWENLKIEILHATDKETAHAACETLIVMLAVLYTVPEPIDPPAGLAPKIMAEMLKELESPEKALAAPAATIVACLVRAGNSTAYLAVYGLLERMLELFKDPDDISLRAPILGHIATIVRSMRASYELSAAAESKKAVRSPSSGPSSAAASASSKLSFTVQSVVDDSKRTFAQILTGLNLPSRTYKEDRKPLDPFRDQLLAALHNGIRSPSYRTNALSLFVHLCHIDGFLTPQELDYLAEAVNGLLVPTEGQVQTEEVRRLAMDSLMELAKINTRTLEATTLPLLFEKLPDQMKETAEGDDAAMKGADSPNPAAKAPPGPTKFSAAEIRQRVTIRYALGALSRFGMHSYLFDVLIVKLLTKFDLSVSRACANDRHRNANVGYARGLISSLFTIAQQKELRGDRDLGKYAQSSIPRLLTTMLSHVVGDAPSPSTVLPIAADPSLIRDVGALLSLFARNLTLEKQKDLSRKTQMAIEDGKFSELLEQPRFKPTAASQAIFKAAQSPNADSRYLLVSLYLPMKKEVELPFSKSLVDWVQLHLSLFEVAKSSLQFDACALSISSAINKFASDPLPTEISHLLDELFQKHVQSGPMARRVLGLRLYLAVVKAVAIRNNKSTEAMVDRVLALCEDPQLGSETARALQILAREDTEFLTKENGITIRLLNRQRLFAALLPKVIQGYRSTTTGATGDDMDTWRQSVYLIALTSLLPHMPKSTTNERLKELFPLLIRALDLPDAQTRGSAANTIAIAVITAHLEKRKAEEEEVQSKTSRAAAGGLADFTSSNVGNGLALSLAEDHIGSLIKRLLAMIEPQNNSLESTRIAALRCLAALAKSIPYVSLHPHRILVQTTLGDVGRGVDDPRRTVRLEAVECRDAWFALRE